MPWGKLVKGLAFVSGALLIYAAAGFYGLPYLIKSLGPEKLKELTQQEAAIDAIEFNPFDFRIAIKGFKLQGADRKPFVSFDAFNADVEFWQSMKSLTLVFSELGLAKPTVRVAKAKDGSFNFSAMFPAKKNSEPEKGPLFPVRIGRIKIESGKLLWEDAHLAQPVKEEIDPVNFTVENFVLAKGQTFPIRLAMALKSGGTLNWQGEAGIEPLWSKGHVELAGVTLEKAIAMTAGEIAGASMQGSETIRADYTLQMSSDQSLQLDLPKSRVDVKNFVYQGGREESLSVRGDAVALEADIKITTQLLPEKKFQLEIPKSRMEVKNFVYEESGKGNLSVQSDAVDLESVYKITAAKGNWQVASEKSQASANSIRIAGVGLKGVTLAVDRFEFGLDSETSRSEGKINVIVKNGMAAVTGALMQAASKDKPLVSIRRLKAENLAVDLSQHAITIAAINSDHADLRAWLDERGDINYLSLVEREDKQPATKVKLSAGLEKASPWRLLIQSIALNDYGVRFEDRSVKKPIVMDLKPINLNLKKFSEPFNTTMPIEFSAKFSDGGNLNFNGNLGLSPFKTDLQVSLKDFGLDRFQPYFERFARLDVIDGDLFVEGKLKVELAGGDKGPDISYQGLVGIEELVTRDQLQNKDFIKWRKLTLSGIDADLRRNRYTAKGLVIDRPYARVVIKKDKTVNITEVLAVERKNAGGKTSAPAPNAKKDVKTGPYFKLNEITIRDGASDFADLSLILPFAAEIKELNGGAAGVSSEKNSKVAIKLKGNAYDLSPVDINGEVSPYQGAFDVGISFHGLPMPLVSPYMVQFAGYKVEKGKLDLDLKYKVEEGKLTAANNILIDHFELGEKIENPDAVSVPLELAVTLLKDSDGKIKLDVPITGSLDDPQFSVGGLVVDALLNVLQKAVTSPFRALSSLFAEGEEPDHVDFKPGSDELDKAQQAKLEGVAKALKEKPTLSLEIKGAAFEVQDWPALKEAALYDRLKRMKAAATGKKGGKKIRAEYVELSEDDYNDYLAQMFIEKFPLLAERSFLGTPKLKDETAGEFNAVAKQKLFTIIKPEQDRLQDLAAKRAQAIAKFIVQKGGIGQERVYILDTVVSPGNEGEAVLTRLSLRID